MWLMLLLSARADDGVAGYYRSPDVHGDTVVFTAEGDLWTAPLTGGLATRLTRAPGEELGASFSPDGKWIAFTGNYQESNDVFVIPSAGGEPRRLTWHPDGETVLGWTPDGQHVLYSSSRNDPQGWDQVYKVPVAGGPSERLPIARAATLAIHGDGKTVAFTPTTTEGLNCKRYVGGTAANLFVGDLSTQTYRQLTTWVGTDFRPMWHGDRIFFLSDRAGMMDLWSLKADGSDLQQHTSLQNFDARAAAIGGDTIVFTQGADLVSYHIPTQKLTTLSIRLRTDQLTSQPKNMNALDVIGSIEPAPDGSRLYIEGRGAIASFPQEEGRRIDLHLPEGGKARGLAAFADGKRLAAWVVVDGEEQLTVFDAEGRRPPEAHPATRGGWHFPPVVDPTGEVVAWADQTDTLWIYELATKQLTRIDNDPLLEIDDYHFSPDGRWLAYVRTADNGNGTVWLYDRQTGGRIQATDPDYHSYAPTWDPKGRYLYFASQRTFDPLISGDDSSPGFAWGPLADMPEFAAFFDEISLPYMVLLQSSEPSPFLSDPPLAPLNPPPPPKKSKKKQEEEPELTVKVDTEGLWQRTLSLPAETANIYTMAATEGGLYYLTRPALRLMDVSMAVAEPPGDLQYFDLEEKESQEVMGGINGFRVSADGETLVIQQDGRFQYGDVGAGAPEEAYAVHGWDVWVNQRELWRDLFEESWRMERDFFWDVNMIGADWKALKERYGVLVDRISTRNELNDLIGELIGELSNPHAYVGGGGGWEIGGWHPTGLLGADLVADPAVGAWKLARIYRGESWSDELQSPLAAPHVNVPDGAYLFAVDGRPVPLTVDPLSALAGKAGEAVILSVGADKASARDVLVYPLGSEGELRYHAWVQDTRKMVAEKTNDKVGYLHIRDMMGTGFADFSAGWFAQHNRDGFIIDVRGNGGGYISRLVIERIARQLTDFVKSRNQAPDPEMFRAFYGAIVVICDEGTASDGEAFTSTFQAMKLGTVVGSRTWGGLVGLRVGKLLQDGGFLSMPEFGFFDLEQKWVVEGWGAVPDVAVAMDPTAHARGEDPQLDAAIRIVQEQMQKVAPLPTTPAYPDRSLDGFRKAYPVQKTP